MIFTETTSFFKILIVRIVGIGLSFVILTILCPVMFGVPAGWYYVNTYRPKLVESQHYAQDVKFHPSPSRVCVEH